MRKVLLKSVAAVIFILNSYVLVESAMILGTVIDSLIAKDFGLFKNNMLLLAVYSLLSLLLPVNGFKIVYYISFKEMLNLKSSKFASDLLQNTEDMDLSEYSQNIDLIYSGILLNKWNLLNITCVFIFTAIRISVLSVTLFIIAFIASALPLIIPVICQKSLKDKSSDFLKESGKYVSFVKDKLDGKSELFRYDGMKWAIDKHNILSKNHEMKRKNFKFLNVLASISSEGVSGIGQVIILFAGGIFAYRGIIQIGETVALLQLMNYLAGPVVTMVSLINDYISSMPAYKKFKGKNSGEKSDNSNNNRNFENDKIILHNIDFAYGAKKIFTNLNLCFEYKKSYLITGVSGRGKSSLLKLIAGEILPEKGEVSVFGRKLNNANKKEIFDLISYVSQDTYIFEASVQENIAFDRAKDSSEIKELIESMQLELNPEEILNHSRNISGGEKKRIGLARALINPKEIILLDEITNGLNNELAIILTEKILSLNKTVIFVSHNESEQFRKMFDFIIDLNNVSAVESNKERGNARWS
nr:ABC transporter ATP-binding protein [uncultured Acetatifactor sp.]